MTKSTPGPWNLKIKKIKSGLAMIIQSQRSLDDESFWDKDSDELYIFTHEHEEDCERDSFGFYECEQFDETAEMATLSEANARLITAAPELLAACKAFSDAKNENEDELAAKMISAAIAKAEGESE